MGIKYKAGYTLLELILVLGIMAIVLPAGFSMFLASMRAQLKVTVLQEVKRNGDTALSVMDSLIKTRALSLQQLDGTVICNAADSTFSAGDVYFVDNESNRFRFFIENDRIASESSVIGTVYLTGTKVAISGFSITCERESVFTSPLISISYVVTQDNVTRRAEESATLNYQTRIRLRTY